MSSLTIAQLVTDVAAESLAAVLDRHGTATVTDFGAAEGELLQQLEALLPETISSRITWRAVDVRGRPSDLPQHVQYLRGDVRSLARELAPTPGLAIAHELLDDLPCEIVEIDDDLRRRIVLVDTATGHEVLGPGLDDGQSCARIGLAEGAVRQLNDWCDRWWPRREPTARVEVGVPRDEAWRSIASTVSEGNAVAIDYGHVLTERNIGRWDGGTLTGYRAGRVVRPVPDGSLNLTAHVAMDSCASSSEAATSHLTATPDGMWCLVQRMGR